MQPVEEEARRREPGAPGPLVRAAAKIAAAASVSAGRAAIALGLRRAPEGWRRTVGVLLRSEATRFALSAFGLRVPASGRADGPAEGYDARVAGALLSFLSGEPDAHFRLAWQPAATLRQRVPFVDVALLRFSGDGRLEEVVPVLAPAGPAPPPPGIQAAAHTAIVAAYNRSAALPEAERTHAIARGVRSALSSGRGAQSYAARLLAACCLSFDARPLARAAERFQPPPFASRRSLGFGFLSWIGRPSPGGAAVDLWVSAHHVGLDGVPLQDLLTRLERAWGTEEVVYPPAEAGRTFAGPDACHAPGEREVDQLLTFADFAPLLALRRTLNAADEGGPGGSTTVGALIAWLLSQEPEFAGVRIASTVDVAASGGYERDVDVVSLRPADYATGHGPWGGFDRFAREFNRLVAAARSRTSPVRAGMQTSGLLPAWAHAALVRADPGGLDETFGTLCVTIVREARIFIAPMTDLGLRHGFFAIGSTNLPSASGSAVTAVSVKGDAGRIADYPAILQRVLERCAELDADLRARGGGLVTPLR